jgi:hypothetical protein
VAVISQVLGNRTVQWFTRLARTLSVPMVGIGLLLRESGRHPGPIWEVLGFVGVAVVVLSVPPQTYYWCVLRRRSQRKVLPNKSGFAGWREDRSRSTQRLHDVNPKRMAMERSGNCLR